MERRRLRLGSLWLAILGFGLAAVSFQRQFATPEFSGLGWGLVVSLPFGACLSAVLVFVQLLWVILSGELKLWTASQVWAAPLLSAAAGIAVWMHTAQICAPKARLKKIIGGHASFANNVNVAGFNSFLSVRWYARFSLPMNAAVELARHRGLTNVGDVSLLENLRQQSPYGKIALAAGVVPEWSAARIWYRDTGQLSSDTQSTSWSWLAIDSTGTNCFYTWGYQN